MRTATVHDMTIVGYQDGYSGFVEGEFQELDDRSVGNIIQRGGTVLGTSRCPEFLEAKVRAAAVDQMRQLMLGAEPVKGINIKALVDEGRA